MPGPHWKFSKRTLRGYPATMTAQWCSQGPSGSTKADADAKSVTKEAVYMLAFRCLVLLTQANEWLRLLCGVRIGTYCPWNVLRVTSMGYARGLAR